MMHSTFKSPIVSALFSVFLLSTSAFGPWSRSLGEAQGMVGNAVVWDLCRRGRCWLWQGRELAGLVGVGNGPENRDQGMEEEKPPEVTRVCQQGRAEGG